MSGQGTPSTVTMHLGLCTSLARSWALGEVQAYAAHASLAVDVGGLDPDTRAMIAPVQQQVHTTTLRGYWMLDSRMKGEWWVDLKGDLLIYELLKDESRAKQSLELRVYAHTTEGYAYAFILDLETDDLWRVQDNAACLVFWDMSKLMANGPAHGVHRHKQVMDDLEHFTRLV